MRDPVGGLPGEVGRVGAADQQVAGVQAQRDRGPAEHPLHLVAVLDHGAHVGVQHGADAMLGCPVADPVQVAQQQVPAVVVEDGPAVVAVEPGRRGEHEDLGAGGVVLLQDAVDRRERVVAGQVHHHGSEATDRGQLVGGEHSGHLVGVGGEEALRAELGGGEPDVAHLVEHPARGELVAPVGDLADPPGDRGSGDPGPARRSAARCWWWRVWWSFLDLGDLHRTVLLQGKGGCLGHPRHGERVVDGAGAGSAPGDDLGERGELGDGTRRPAGP